MGINLNLSRHYGRAPRGVRVVEAVPVNTPVNTSFVGALGARKMLAGVCLEGAVDQESFACFAEQMLAPKLKRGQVVLIDNAAPHQSERVQRAIEAVGAILIYLPAYSPDYNPIEECWSKLKAFLRARAARTRKDLWRALQQALATITPQNIAGWFHHAGYYFSSELNPL